MSIHITDRTMAHIGGLSDDKPSVSRFLELLTEMEVDAIEITEATRLELSPLPEYRSYIVVDNDKKGRGVVGFDDALCGDYLETFSRLRDLYGYDVVFCPGNRFHCATALAVEWLTCGNGGNVAASFCGIGGLAATEEVIMALRTMGLRGVDKTYKFLPEMTALFRKITGKKIRADKPVIGERIFHVESGVHVDGIIKNPACYEPFPPEVVGLSRKIILGKQSGAASIRAKLSEFDIICNDDDVKLILDKVKARAVEINGEVADDVFVEIAMEYQS